MYTRPNWKKGYYFGEKSVNLKNLYINELCKKSFSHLLVHKVTRTRGFYIQTRSLRFVRHLAGTDLAHAYKTCSKNKMASSVASNVSEMSQILMASEAEIFIQGLKPHNILELGSTK